MSVDTPDSAAQVEDRIKADVQRSAPDSNPYLSVHWLRSLIAGIARRIFDFYRDLARTEARLFPDTADEETAPIWGNIYVGPRNVETGSSGLLVATGTAGGLVGIGETLTAGGNEYTTVTSGVLSAETLNVLSITRSGTTATVLTASAHNLSSFVPVDISGADQAEYNLTAVEIVVTGLDSFTYQVTGSPTTPATGTILCDFVTATVTVDSVGFGDEVNLDVDTPVVLQAPIVNVDDTFYVTFGAVGGGAEEEAIPAYKERYLDKIRNPVAHFNVAEITATAKTVNGVTRVFVEEAGATIGSIGVNTLTRNGNVATAVTLTPHGYDDGQLTTINGATEVEYNVVESRIIVEDPNTFHYVVLGAPSTPATGGIQAAATLPLGQVRTLFMRDNDVDPIPSASEVQDVKDVLDAIRPANTSTFDNIVKAPDPVPVAYTFTQLVPNTASMREAVDANISQFHDEDTVVGVDVDEDAYRAAIKNTVDPDTGDSVASFALATPVGDITIGSAQIATKGGVTF